MAEKKTTHRKLFYTLAGLLAEESILGYHQGYNNTKDKREWCSSPASGDELI